LQFCIIFGLEAGGGTQGNGAGHFRNGQKTMPALWLLPTVPIGNTHIAIDGFVTFHDQHAAANRLYA
jgi:hypothetical protein